MTTDKILDKKDLRPFLDRLQKEAEIIGPTRKGGGPTRKGGITGFNYLAFARIENLDDLVLDYYTTGVPPKRHFMPDGEVLFTFQRKDGEVMVRDERPRPEKRVMVGVHPCDIAALKRLDRVFDDTYRDPYFHDIRDNTAIIGWTCNDPADSCFCGAMGTGPDAADGYDLLFTDLGDRYFIKLGTPAGEKLLKAGSFKDAGPDDVRRREEVLAQATEQLKPGVEAAGLRDLMAPTYNDEVWDRFSDRCVSCGACNMVCPTCVCFSVVDKANVDETEGKRIRVWDSCHYHRFAKMAGDVDIRGGKSSRFKHRMFDKFVYTVDRYGEASCVGCGRCVQFCQNFIDLRELLASLREQ